MNSAGLRSWVFGIVLCTSCGGAPEPERSAHDFPRRVVLVVLDSVRADRVGALGGSRGLTPRLDALSADGLLFERAYSVSSYGPQALSALWTGYLPSQGGSTGTGAVPHPTLLSLPRLFRRAGYRTALATNFVGLRARAFTQGFDELEVDSVPGRWSGERVTEKALELADGAATEPLFLVVDYADASEPHQPPAELRLRIDVPVPEQPLTLAALRAQAGSLAPDLAETPAFKDLVARYDAEVAYVDQCLGRLVDGLAARRLLDETLLIVTSSHGLEFLEHGYVGSGWTLHEEVLCVPLVVCAPGRMDPGRISAPVSTADLFPSLRRILARNARDQELDARALFELRGGRILPLPPPRGVLAELVLPELCILRASIQGQEKLVDVVESAAPGERAALLASYEERRARVLSGEAERTDPLSQATRRQFYDLARDPREAHDLVEVFPERGGALAEALARYVALCRTSDRRAVETSPAEFESEPADLDTLKQLGYL